jgi:hypothetical protein
VKEEGGAGAKEIVYGEFGTCQCAPKCAKGVGKGRGQTWKTGMLSDWLIILLKDDHWYRDCLS